MTTEPTTTQPTIAVVDLETTGLDPTVDGAYEFGVVIREPGEPDREYRRWVDLGDLGHLDLRSDGANAEALAVGRFHDRHPQWVSDEDETAVVDRSEVRWEPELVGELAELLDGTVLAGVQVGSFDALFLQALFARNGVKPTWSYRHLEISSYAAAAIGLPTSPGLDSLLDAYRIRFFPGDRHTALGDARLERDLYDAARARLRGMAPARPATHPEPCGRCGGENITWSADSPLWNAVMRGGSIVGPERYGDLVCPICFVQLAEEQGIADLWRLDAERVYVPLETVTPSGRVWNEKTRLWDAAPAAVPDVTADAVADARQVLAETGRDLAGQVEP